MLTTMLEACLPAGRMIGISLAALALSGCIDNPVTGGAAAADDVARLSAGAQGRLWTQDDEWAAMADTLPGGFAGFYIDRGEIVVLATDATRGTALVERLRQARSTAALMRGRQAAVRAVAHDFRQLKDWYDALLRVIDGDSFVFLDIDETENRITVGIAEPSRRASVHRAAREAGIPAHALRISEMGAIVPDQQYLYDEVRPVIGGLQILPTGCTLGFNVFHHLYGQSFVTNSHCTNWVGRVDAEVAYQGHSSPRIGVETWDRAVFTGTPAGCPKGRVCRNADAALFKYDPEVQVQQGGIALTTGYGSLQLGPSNAGVGFGVDNWCMDGYPCTMFVVGDIAQKVGATTGWTTGTVASTCALVSYPSWVNPGNVSLPCQVGATYHSAGGDSGSPVFRIEEWYGTNLLGIHHSSNNQSGIRFFSGLSAVRWDLNPQPWDAKCSVRVTTGWSWQC